MTFFNAPFSHIYVEKEILNLPETRSILEKFRGARLIDINHYKDVFCRRRQSVEMQNRAPMLILAKKREPYLYKGSPVCQNFDEKYFYYTSCVMNCLYDCEYCYLKGMYPSGNLVIFVNLEDTFSEVKRLLREHEVYLCVSYDTDLMALEDVTGFVLKWIKFAAEQPRLKLEIRTKCGRTDLWQKFAPQKNVIFAFTLSPQEIIEKYEHRTSSLASRISCAKMAAEQGFSVRLCFDPMIYIPGWRKYYAALWEQVVEQMDMDNVCDVSVGSFRISQEYLKKIRRVLPDSAVVQFPFENSGGFYHYPDNLMEEMEQFMVGKIREAVPEEKIFRWRT